MSGRGLFKCYIILVPQRDGMHGRSSCQGLGRPIISGLNHVVYMDND